MGRENPDFNTRSPDSPVQFARAAQFRFLRIDLAAGQWGYRPEISRQVAWWLWGGEASFAGGYLQINKIIIHVRGGEKLGLTEPRVFFY